MTAANEVQGDYDTVLALIEEISSHKAEFELELTGKEGIGCSNLIFHLDHFRRDMRWWATSLAPLSNLLEEEISEEEIGLIKDQFKISK
jgi:hypothetical protein